MLVCIMHTECKTCQDTQHAHSRFSQRLCGSINNSLNKGYENDELTPRVQTEIGFMGSYRLEVARQI